MKTKSCLSFFFVVLLVLGFVFFIFNQIQLISTKGKIEKGTEFSGTVKKIYKSNNHSFGIILINIENIIQLNKDALNYSVGKPFRIRENQAEIYGTIGFNDTSANQIIVNTTLEKFYLYRNGRLVSVGNLVWINEFQNLDFIKRYSDFRSGQ